VFGDTAPIALPKAIFGETFGASGALACACALAWFGGVPVQPLASRASRASGATGAASAPPDHVLVVAVGYYGNASAIVMRRAR
jgi:hypothetical protein